MMNLPPQPGPQLLGGVPVISDTSEIFDGSLSRVVMSKIWNLKSLLPGDGIENRLVVALRVVGFLRIVPIVRGEPDVDPVLVGRVRLGRELQGLPALQIVVPDQLHVLRAIGPRIGSRLLRSGRR